MLNKSRLAWPGDTFTLFTAGAYSGDFASLDLPGLPAGEQWVTDDLSAGQLSVTPEPAALGMVGLFASVGLLRRRRSGSSTVA
jgi:hypothetical protein